MATNESTTVPTCFPDWTDGTPIAGTPVPRPCPFCGNFGAGINGGSSESGSAYNAICPTCFAEGPTGESALEAAEKWNARMVEESLDELLDLSAAIVTPRPPTPPAGRTRVSACPPR